MFEVKTLIDQEKVKLMTKLSIYESSSEKDDIRITSYFKKDYVSFHTLISCLWITVAYIIIVAVVGLSFLDELIVDISINRMIQLFSYAVAGYVIFLVLYIIACAFLYGGKHKRAKKRIKQYYRDMSQLERMLAKEKDKV